jgi:predicted ATPase/transcriptional regulator with XRE-family HTH domain
MMSDIKSDLKSDTGSCAMGNDVGGAMREELSFGAWLKRRRRALDLTQEALAQLVGCAGVTIRKYESDEQRPSRAMAERLAQQLQLAPEEWATFVQFARVGLDDAPPDLPIPASAQLPVPGEAQQPVYDAVVPGAAPAAAADVPPSLPQPATPFIGRLTELAALGTLLDDPACRLLTLIGPGGIGKTRLALEVASVRAARYPHGVWFVDLAQLSSADHVVSAIADAFNLTGMGVGDAKDALRNYLRTKTLLLVLDNFEHVLAATDLIAELLTAPGIQVLVTSRERLRLRAERVYALDGLTVPPDATQVNAETFDAVRMFVACVRHTYPQYALDAAELLAVTQICRLAVGMPLGIELAAAWVPTLPVATIATELAASLDLLETTMRDVPGRHRSIRAVFAHSWALLDAEEQTAFRQLSVFRGSFTREAAQQVAGATLGILARLVDTSLVRVHRSGRYSMHELLRQFAADQLEADPEAATRTCDRHSAFYLEWLQHKYPEVRGRQQLAALDEIEREFENVRSAWYWGLQRGQWGRLRRAQVALTFFMAVRARLQETIALLQDVIDAIAAVQTSAEGVAERQGLAAYALTSQSWFFSRSGQLDKQLSCLERSRPLVQQYGTPYDIALHYHFSASTHADAEEARAMSEQALAIFREIGATWEVAYTISGMGDFAFGRGETLEARRHYDEGLALYRAIGETQGTGLALLNLGRVAYTLGDYDEGRRLLEESLAMKRVVGSKIRSTECLELLGEIAFAQGQFAEAEARFREALVIVPSLSQRERLGLSLARLGATVLAQDRLGQAAELFAESLAIAEECDNAHGIAFAHVRLGFLALRQTAPEAARRHWHTALVVVSQHQDRAHLLVMLDALIGLAALLAQVGDTDGAVELLALVHLLSRIDHHTQLRAEQLLADLQTRLSEARFAALQARGKALQLGDVIAELLAEGEAR